MTLKSAEPNNDAEILQLVQCVIDNICKFTSNDALRNSAPCSVTKYTPMQF